MHSMKIVDLRGKILVGVAAALGIALTTPMVLARAETGATIQIYDARELAQRDNHYRGYIQAVFREDLIGQLPLQERSTLSDARLVLPQGVVAAPPIAVGAKVPERTIYFPIQTIAFLDDLAALAAWLSRHDCSFEPGTLYAGMIVSKAPPAGHTLYPNPRTAFGLGDNVWDDPYVKKSSNQVFKTAVFFILAHELGHIRYGHAPYNTITREQAQRQEMQADRYAIDAMRHVGVPPLGMFPFFTMLSRMEGSVPITHPLSGSRLLQIARALEQSPEDFVPPNESKSRWVPVIRHYGSQFRTLIPVVDNPALRAQLTSEAQFTSWSALRRSCPQ